MRSKPKRGNVWGRGFESNLHEIFKNIEWNLSFKNFFIRKFILSINFIKHIRAIIWWQTAIIIIGKLLGKMFNLKYWGIFHCKYVPPSTGSFLLWMKYLLIFSEWSQVLLFLTIFQKDQIKILPSKIAQLHNESRNAILRIFLQYLQILQKFHRFFIFSN